MPVPIAWQPEEEASRRAQLQAFLDFCGEADFPALYRRSIDDIEWFTGKLLEFLHIEFDPAPVKLLDLSEGIARARWCVGAGLNIAAACLDHNNVHQPAVTFEGEDGTSRSWSYRALRIAVSKCTAGLRDLGITKGDAVGVHLPMMPETVAVMVALARIGAVAVPLFTGYGPGAIESRLRDVEAKALFTCNAFPRRGRPVFAKNHADEAVSGCPSVRHIIVVERMAGLFVPMTGGRDITFEDLCNRGSDSHIEPTLAEDPLLIIYSSGTTGKPKGIVHSHGSFPLKAAADMALSFDVKRGTRISWVTDIGWMMGPWLIYGALLLGGTLTLYDGAPDYPHPARLWAFAERQAVEILGISPTLIRCLQAAGDRNAEVFNLSRLRAFGSTGEPWNPEPWFWLFHMIGRGRVPILNYSGGTEISGGILSDNLLLPIKPCGFAAPCLGIDAAVFDEDGNPVTGRVGELVIRQPWLGMPLGFHGDQERYWETYWSTYPGVWRHGDFAVIDEDGHWFIQGRSDDTLKLAGKRVGPAEVESVLVSHPLVVEAAAIGVPDGTKGSALLVFVALKRGSGNAALGAELADLVARQLGKPLRPSGVEFLSSIPKTRNGKLMRRIVRAAWLGLDTGDTTALENPGVLEEIRQRARSR